MKFKVGDVVTVRTPSQLLLNGWISDGYGWVKGNDDRIPRIAPAMLKYSGHQITIEYIEGSSYISKGWYWIDDMFVLEPKKPRLPKFLW